MSPSLTLGEMMRSAGKIEILISEEYYEEKKKIMTEILVKAELENKDKNLQIAGKNFEHFKKAAENQNIN